MKSVTQRDRRKQNAYGHRSSFPPQGHYGNDENHFRYHNHGHPPWHWPQVPGWKATLRIDGWAKQLFQCPDIFGEGLSAGFGDAIESLRPAQYEPLFDSHVPGFFELEQLRSQVAVGGLSLGAEPCKLSLFHADEQRKQGQSQPAVHHGIELGQIRHGLDRAVCAPALRRSRRRCRTRSGRERWPPETRSCPANRCQST